MPQLATESYRPIVGIYRQDDEASTSQLYASILRQSVSRMRESLFWTSKNRIVEARWRLHRTLFLRRDWDTYGAEPPSERARSQAMWILDQLEGSSLPPNRLMASAEGGIAMSFVEGNNRAEIEVYNDGEIVAAVYSAEQDPVVWEVADANPAMQLAIHRIRVHLTK